MKTLIEIKDNYAKEQGFENWHEIKKAFRDKEINFLKFGRYENKVFELIQQEQQNIIAEKIPYETIDEREVLNDLIINENNIIK